MQGTSGRSHSLLLQALNNAADGSLRLALWVKISEKKANRILFTFWVFLVAVQISLKSLMMSLEPLINFNERFRKKLSVFQIGSVELCSLIRNSLFPFGPSKGDAKTGPHFRPIWVKNRVRLRMTASC